MDDLKNKKTENFVAMKRAGNLKSFLTEDTTHLVMLFRGSLCFSLALYSTSSYTKAVG